MTASHPEAMLLFPIHLGARCYLLCELASCDLISPGICLHCVPWGPLAKKRSCCCPLTRRCTAALIPNGEMPRCCSQKGLGRSEPGWVFLGDVDISVLKLDSQPHALWTRVAAKSPSETSCSRFPCMLTSGQCLLTISHTFPTGMRFCTYSDYTAAPWFSVFCLLCSPWKDGCLFLYPRISFTAPVLVISLMLSVFSGCFDTIILNCFSVVSSFCNSNIISYSLSGWELL